MAAQTILITGANGEIGHGLIEHLAQRGSVRVVALDVRPLDAALQARCYRTVVGDILDPALLERLSAEHEFSMIFHLAAVLSTKAERQPGLGHRVNVDGTLNLLEMAAEEARRNGRDVIFLFPSSIAVYGLPDLEHKRAAGRVREAEWCEPRTMYGVNKLYCEQLGRYYAHYYRQLDQQTTAGRVDFRALRFPGLISAATLPTGGTSDFAPEMLHQAAQGLRYHCFVRRDTRIPFMAMPDAITALLRLAEAPRERLSHSVYNVGAFNPSAEELEILIRAAFPDTQVDFLPDLRRQAIVDSWPADVDDSAARTDWGWAPRFALQNAFADYLFPAVIERYRP
ncbi:MAG: NAD-dependent epimerase/dehydratase family protein [Anaerolineales bacterium]|nr:NAD-dependent epimerase/dehydratase family protein [Anaerolineales bacterium]